MEDQTEKNWITPTHPKELGTGLFLTPNFDQKIISINITHFQMQSIAGSLEALAAKWIPFYIKEASSIKIESCGQHCNGSCVEPACICDSRTNTCK
ncbi:MAG TPA: hypothetical protein VE035_06660 [Puia sp.]|nr:hypothetical protein [Puia sp.]